MIYCPVCGGHADYIGSKEDKPNNTQERLRECDICGVVIPEGRQICFKCERGAGV